MFAPCLASHSVQSRVVSCSRCAAVGVIAYGTGHGSQAGSVYLEVWACVFLSLDIATTNLVLLIRERSSLSEEREEFTDVGESRIEGPHPDGTNAGVDEEK